MFSVCSFDPNYSNAFCFRVFRERKRKKNQWMELTNANQCWILIEDEKRWWPVSRIIFDLLLDILSMQSLSKQLRDDEKNVERNRDHRIIEKTQCQNRWNSAMANWMKKTLNSKQVFGTDYVWIPNSYVVICVDRNVLSN